jgi:hypothetical protein
MSALKSSGVPAPKALGLCEDARIIGTPFFVMDYVEGALLDWELSTLGDPLADFGYHMSTWILRGDEFRGMAGADLTALGIPKAPDYLMRYAERRVLGAIDPGLWDYCLVYNLFRLAAILQGDPAGDRQTCRGRHRRRGRRQGNRSARREDRHNRLAPSGRAAGRRMNTFNVGMFAACPSCLLLRVAETSREFALVGSCRFRFQLGLEPSLSPN